MRQIVRILIIVRRTTSAIAILREQECIVVSGREKKKDHNTAMMGIIRMYGRTYCLIIIIINHSHSYEPISYDDHACMHGCWLAS